MSIQSNQLFITTPSYTNSKDFMEFANKPEAKKKIEGIERCYYGINVAQAMKNLSEVSGLLRSAYEGSQGSKCKTDVLEIMINYQSFIKDTVILSDKFVQTCLHAIRSNKLAIKHCEKENLDAAKKIFSKSSDMAGQMAEESGRLVTKSEKLSILVENALIQATNDEVDNSIRQQQIVQLIAEAEAIVRKSKTLAKELNVQIEKEIIVEKNYAIKSKEAIKAKSSSIKSWFIKSLTGGIIFDQFESDEIYFRAEEKHAAERRKEAQNVLSEANAKLAESVFKLKDFGCESIKVDKIQTSLKVTMKTLLKIMHVFEYARTFLKGVKAQFLAVGNKESIEILAEADLCDEVKEELIENTWNWFVLGKVSHAAKQSIHQIDSDLDQSMMFLPKKSDSSKIREQIFSSILAQLENEKELLTSPKVSQSDDNDTNH